MQIADPSSDHLRLEHSEAEREAAADIAHRFAVEICDLLRRMPRALLLLLKTNDCLRSVDYALGTVRHTTAAVLRRLLTGNQVGLIKVKRRIPGCALYAFYRLLSTTERTVLRCSAFLYMFRGLTSCARCHRVQTHMLMHV